MKKAIKLLFFALAFCSLIPLTTGSVSASALDTFIEGGKGPQPFETNFYNQGLAELDVPVQYATQSRDPYVLIGRIIRIALSFLGIGAVSLMVYAGFTWMTAAGNEERVSEAKKTMRNAVIGLILILMSYSLTWFVVSRLQRATNTYGPGTGSSGWSFFGPDEEEEETVIYKKK